MTNKDLQKFLKQFPKDVEIRMHWKNTCEGGESKAIHDDDIHIEAAGEIMRRLDFFYMVGARNYYICKGERIYRQDIECIFIG